jgi:hypothetical protein
MSLFKLTMNGPEPNKWPVVKIADIGYDEEFVKQISELRPLVDAGMIGEPLRSDVKESITSILVDGLMPAFLDLREIRASIGRDVPLMNHWKLYEDFSGNLWKSYKHLMQRSTELMANNIGFLFQDEKKFREGLVEIRRANPNLRTGFETFLEETRNGWQNDLKNFRNTWIEHPTGDRKQFQKFYDPKYAEWLFDTVWRTIADILPVLLELHLPHGTLLVEQRPDDPGARWASRFRYQL